MATQQGVIKAFMKSLDTTSKKGEAALDEAVKASSNFTSTQALINQMLADHKSYIKADPKNGWKKFLLEKCGINLDNKDTGAITGSDAGGSKVKTATSVVPNKSFDTSFNKTSFTKRGVTFQLAYQDSVNELTDKEKDVWQGLYSFWAEESLKLIEESYGYSLNDSDAKFKKILIFFVDDSSDSNYTAISINGIYGDSDEKYAYIGINMYYFKNIDQNSLDGKYPYWDDYYLDRLIAHELTHTVMKAKVDNFSSLPPIIKEGLAELTVGMDDSDDTDIKIAVSSESMLKNLLVLQEDYNELDGINNEDYVAGYILLRYLARQAGDLTINNTKDTKVQTFYGNDSITSSVSKATITSGAGNDYILNNGGSNVKISGGDGADKIYSYGSKTSINTGKGNDFVYLYADASSATVNANSTGNKEIHSAAQTAYITTGAGNDYIKIYTNASKNTVNAGAGNNTIYSGAQTAAITAGAGKDYIYLYSDATNTKVNAGAGNDTIYSLAQTATITAGAGNDSIRNYGSSVTIEGGTGNDTIYNNWDFSKNKSYGDSDGANVLLKYTSGNGNDKIYGFNATSTLQIGNGSGTYTSAKSGNNIIVTVDTGKITLQGAANLSTVNIKGKKVITNNKSKALVTGTAYADSIENYGSNSTINALAGNDFIGSYRANSSVNAGAGNDTIQNTSYGTKTTLLGGAGNDSIRNSANAKIYGGAGNDTITNTDLGSKATLFGGAGSDYITSYNADNVSISGGDGNDDIDLFGTIATSKGVTVTGGKGNDTLWGDNGANKFIYANGDGKDIIYGFDNTDMLKITGTFFSSYSSSKKEIYFKVGSTANAITLKDFSATSFNVNGINYKISGSKLVKK